MDSPGDATKLQALINKLEDMAKEVEAPTDIVMAEGVKDRMDWHCSSRAAGIRDAIRSIRIMFGV